MIRKFREHLWASIWNEICQSMYEEFWWSKYLFTFYLISWQYWRTDPHDSSKTESIKAEIYIQMSFPEFVSLFSNVL